MDAEKFVDILIKEVYEDILKDNIQKYYQTEQKETKGLLFESKKIFDALNEHEKEIFLRAIQSNVEDALSVTLSIIDQWGGGYFHDGKDNDGHFELYYVSDEEGKYKYRVDEGSSDLFLEKMEELTKRPS